MYVKIHNGNDRHINDNVGWFCLAQSCNLVCMAGCWVPVPQKHMSRCAETIAYAAQSILV